MTAGQKYRLLASSMCSSLREALPTGSQNLQKLRDWCSAHEKDHTTIEAQLEFIAHELLNSYQGIGMMLKRARSIHEAREAVQPYARRLMDEEGEG